MILQQDKDHLEHDDAGRTTSTDEIQLIEHYFDRLFPLLRSLTGAGVRQSLDILGELMPLERIEVPSGTSVFDWTVPQEWVVREAYLEGPDGTRIVDVRQNNLHLLNCSDAFDGTVTRTDLDEHLYSRPDLPEAIPYVTSYYVRRWGFCLAHNVRESLPDGNYRAVIDTEFVDGAMSMAEVVLRGEQEDEVLLASDICHPSMANDELSGPLALAMLYRRIASWPRRKLTYRFVLHPETVGSIAYLARCGNHLKDRCVAGYVLTNVAVDAGFKYKRSRRGSSLADRAAEIALGDQNIAPWDTRDFDPTGSDERQYCSPGFNLPVGVLSRTPTYYPEYHTSLDNRDFISFQALSSSVELYERMCVAIDGNDAYVNQAPFGEPHLGRRGLYHTTGRSGPPAERHQALLWVLNLSDGDHDLIAIAERSRMPFSMIREAADAAVEAGLLVDVKTVADLSK